MSSSEPPLKKLRSGTRSCLECRRRKVRCNYDTNHGRPPCDNCISRDSICKSQEQVQSFEQIREPTRHRVDRLEAVVQNLSQTIAELRGAKDVPGDVRWADPGSDDGRSEEDDDDDDDDDVSECALSGQPASIDKAFSLPSKAPVQLPKQPDIRERLLALVPSRDDVLAITASANDWWSVHIALLPEGPIKTRVEMVELHRELQSKSIEPLKIGLWLLYFALTVIQVPSTFDFTELESLTDKTAFVSKLSQELELVLKEDSLIGTLIGLQIAVAMASLQKSIGRPKKGWILLRRAITFAELLKLPFARKKLHDIKSPSDAQRAELKLKGHTWDSLCAIERLLCLLLGIPTTASNASMPRLDPNDVNSKTRKIVYVQSDIANHVARRDRLEDEEEAIVETQRILEKLHVVKKTWPPEWTNHDIWTQYDARTAACVLMQTSHGFLILRAHLPYLLKAQEDPRYSQNATECLQACRAILNKYFAVRTRLAVGGFMSKSFDVLAFTACVILLLHRDGRSLHLPTTDAALIENTKSAMRQAKDKDRAALAQRTVLSLNSIQQCLEGDPAAPAVVNLRVPMLGEVSVRRAELQSAEISTDTSTRPVPGSTIADIAFDFDALDDDWYLREGESYSSECG